jgi:hypothetical protein
MTRPFVRVAGPKRAQNSPLAKLARRTASIQRQLSQAPPCALRSTPYIEFVGQVAVCPELPKKRRYTEVSVPYSGGGGAIGWHNNTLK